MLMDWVKTISAHPGEPESPQPELAGRYILREILGTGGFATVFSARDTTRDQDVAIKVLNATEASARSRREPAALRLLQIPGVVRLLDEFDFEGRTCLVMELVPGGPFPGPGASDWDSLEDCALSLLDVLARVHSLGVVHRDLKPANVLVTPEGRPVVLDFGLSAGAPLGRTITQTGQILGTPAYLAPEQLLGRRADNRTDLYAVGVMLYEALTGTLPHGDSATSLLARTTARAPSVSERVEGLPTRVVEVIDSMLALRPEDRPQSAGAVLGLLAGGTASRSHIDGAFPWCGSRASVDELVARTLRGESTRIGGGPGSGRARSAREAAAELETRGVQVVELPAGGRPFSSLNQVLPAAPTSLTQSRALDWAESSLLSVLHLPAVFLVDERRPPDSWTDRIVDRVQDKVPSLRVVNKDPDLEIPPLTPSDLTSLFGGTELLFHIPSDAAAELFRRTGGVAGRVVSELQTWQRAGIAKLDNAGYTITRASLVRLAAGTTRGRDLFDDEQPIHQELRDLLTWTHLAWPHGTTKLLAEATGWSAWEMEAALEALVESGHVLQRTDGVFELIRGRPSDWSEERQKAAHGSLADAFDSDTPARLYHLTAAGRAEELPVAAAALAGSLSKRGRLAEAETAAADALIGLRADTPAEIAEPVATERVEAALAWGSGPAIRRARLDLDRTGLPEIPALPELRLLLQSAEHSLRQDTSRVLDLLSNSSPFDDLRLERRRRALLARAALAAEAPRTKVLGELTRWADEEGDKETLASVSSWDGLAMFRELRFEEAAEKQLAAARRSERPIFKLSARLNAASALQEAGAYIPAARIARAAIETAASLRHPTYEARAHWITRASTYRAGIPPAPHPDLVDAFEALGNLPLLGLLLATESAIHWRRGERELLTVRANRCAEAWEACRVSDAATWARSVAWLGGAEPTDLQHTTIQETAARARLASIGVQIAAITQLAGGNLAPEGRRRAEDELARIPPDKLDHNQGLLTWREMADALAISV